MSTHLIAVIASIVTLSERPDLIDAMWSMPIPWPTYMRKDPVANIFFAQAPPRLR